MKKRKNILYDVGTLPPLGNVPEKMYAWTIREERFGEPLKAFKEEVVSVPEIKDDEVLVAIMVAGLDYNGIWAGFGAPKNVIRNNGDYGDEKQPFHICGSEASGIVYEVGTEVKEFKVGDEVIIGGGVFSISEQDMLNGEDAVLAKDFHIWGYEGNYGGFAQFAKAREIQCIIKPKEINWVDSAACAATGVTAYRMLKHWKGNEVKEGDSVLVWGGTGGLGSIAIQLSKYFGAKPIAVVSSEERGKKAVELGAIGYINRTEYQHWGKLSDCSDEGTQKEWLKGALKFRRAIWHILGEKKLPDIVIEHPGQDTMPTSMFVCAPGGMVVLCGATTSYTGTLDLRFLWLEQKRLQGSHAGDKIEARAFFDILCKNDIRPYIGRVLEWNELPEGHQEIYIGNANGKYAVKVGMK